MRMTSQHDITSSLRFPSLGIVTLSPASSLLRESLSPPHFARTSPRHSGFGGHPKTVPPTPVTSPNSPVTRKARRMSPKFSPPASSVLIGCGLAKLAC